MRVLAGAVRFPTPANRNRPAVDRRGGWTVCRYGDQPAVYSCDLNERCRAPSGWLAILRMSAQVCL